MPRLSIVIPCYNCKKTIGRLLDSVLDNKLSKEDYEVIICDDKSTDGFLDVVKTYEDRINFVYCTTTREVHCPGNTRQAALPYISGDYFTFIDNDDMFEPDFFKNMFDYIDSHPDSPNSVLVSNFREWEDEEQRYGFETVGEMTDTWLHGKFFKTEVILNKYNCYFKEDLFSHEDVFFNSCCIAHLIENDDDYVYLPFFGYKWVYRPDSLSRSFFSRKNYYIDEYLGDFIVGACYPFFDMYLRGEASNRGDFKDFAFNQIAMCILHCYFYYEAQIWRLGRDETLMSSYVAIMKLKRKIVNELNLTPYDIIDYVYNLPERYMNVKKSCFNGTCNFVESQSFRDFILNL